MKNTILSILFTILVFNCLNAQQKIEPKKLKSDIDFLISKYERIHPNLYAYSNSRKFKHEIENLGNELRDSINSVEFWLKIAPIVNSLKDGHTSVAPNYKDVGIHLESFNSKYKNLPFSVFIIDSTIYIREIYCNQEKRIKPGSIIKSINGHSSSEILSKLIAYKSGERLDYRLNLVQQTFLWDFAMFFPGTNYEVEYTEDGKQKQTILNGITDAETNSYSAIAFPEIPDYKFEVIENDIAYVEYNECQNFDKFKFFLDSCFTIISQNKLNNLVIDIRRNQGGDSRLNNLLFTYLYDKPFHSYGKIEVKITDDIKKANGYYAQFNSDTIIEMDTYESNNPVNSLLYMGNIYLLTSGFTFSSGTDCAMLFKDYNVGTIVGQETGGLPTSYGDTYKFKLPNSGLNARVSWKFFLRPSGGNDGKGVIPDIPIKYSINDLISGEDLEMKYVLKQMNND